MRYATESDTEPKLTTLLHAAQQEPVFIQQDENDVAVLVSVREYVRLSNAANQNFQNFCDNVADKAGDKGLTEDKLNALLRDA